MKKILLIIVFIFAAARLPAETLRLKNGNLLTGKIESSTEYTLNFRTKYGVITISRRDVAEVLPDKHRVTLKSGVKIIGVIEDVDQFNIRVKTDEGYVNLDMPKVESIDIYDYETAEAQEKYAKAALARQERDEKTKSSETASTGLTFDDDLDRAFAPKPVTAEPVEYTIVRGAPPVQTTAPEPGSAQEIYKAPAVKEAPAKKDAPKKEAKKSSAMPQTLDGEKRYFSVGAGVIDNKFKTLGGTQTVGGAGVEADIKYMWRLFKTNLWLGPGAVLSTVPKTTFSPAQDVSVDANGLLFHFNLAANYYIAPKAAFQTYLTAAAGMERVSVDLKSTDSSDPNAVIYKSSTASSSGFVGTFGLGVERKFSDTSVGVEARAHNSSRGGGLKGSPSVFYSAVLKASWKF